MVDTLMGADPSTREEKPPCPPVILLCGAPVDDLIYEPAISATQGYNDGGVLLAKRRTVIVMKVLSMKPTIIPSLALVLIGGLSVYGRSVEYPVTPKSLDQGRFVFSISTNSIQEGTSFHVTITAETGVIHSDSSVFVCLVTWTQSGAHSMGPVKPEPQVLLQKDDHIWKVDFIASRELLNNPDVCVVFGVIFHAMVNGKSVPMPAADMYEIKLRDFLKP
jgi:hypothetical protein